MSIFRSWNRLQGFRRWLRLDNSCLLLWKRCARCNRCFLSRSLRFSCWAGASVVGVGAFFALRQTPLFTRFLKFLLLGLATIGPLQSIQPNRFDSSYPLYWFIIKLTILYHKSMVNFDFQKISEKVRDFPLDLLPFISPKTFVFSRSWLLQLLFQPSTSLGGLCTTWWYLPNPASKFGNCGSQPNSSRNFVESMA